MKNNHTSETFTFIDSSQEFQFTVKKEFFKNKNIDSTIAEDRYYLFSQLLMGKYLHSLEIPAILGIKDPNIKTFMIDGKPVKEEEWLKRAHNAAYNYRINTILTE